jgi:hypothetical protein
MLFSTAIPEGILRMSRRETHRHLVRQAHEVVGIQAEMLFEMIESCIQDWIANTPSPERARGKLGNHRCHL